MKLIVGLGNPGKKYEQTRHNLGHRVVESLGDLSLPAKIYKTSSFMNISGPEVSEQVTFNKIDPSDLLVIHDELDLPLGEMKLQFGKSSAGNHGIDSVIEALGTSAFWRLRVGAGPRGDVPGEQFVIERFTNVEEDKLDKIVEEAKKKVKDWVEEKV